MEQKWYFPKDNGGDQKGWNEQGINHFKSSPYGKLAREIIQNSYDAKREECDKVIVKFELSKIPKEKALNMEFIRDSIEACSKYFFDEEEKLTKFLENANDEIKKDYINILKISDYNTTGLHGIETRKKSAWYGLVRSTGNSTKSGTSGGSYGSGKHAPFVFSNFRTIFYGTYVPNEGYAFQGKSILCAHKMEGQLKTNVGYYGNVETIINSETGEIETICNPIRNPFELDEYYRREEPGTDVYIVGTKMKSDWCEEIMLSIVENFWKLILEGKLVVQIKWEEMGVYEEINSENIEVLIHNLSLENKKIDDIEEFTAHKFLEVNKYDIEYIYGSICEENDIRMKIMKLANSLEKKILLMRNTEMKINIKEMRKKQIGFWAIFEAVGEKINEILRDSEPQTHDRWDANNIEDEDKKKFAKQCINKIENWIEEEIGKLLYVDDSEEVDVEGLDMFLIEEDDDNYGKNDREDEKDIFDNRENEVVEEERIESTNKNRKTITAIDRTSTEEPTDGGEEEGGNSPGEGGENEGFKTGNGKNNGKNDGQNTNSKGEEYHLITLPFIGTPYDDKRKIQKLILKSDENISNIKIALYKVGDSGDKEPLKIKNANCKGVKLQAEKNIIQGIDINGVICIDLELEDDRKYIMEVKVYVQD